MLLKLERVGYLYDSGHFFPVDDLLVTPHTSLTEVVNRFRTGPVGPVCNSFEGRS